jgi:hypothetical protein
VLHGLGYAVRGEVAAQLREARREVAQPADVVALEWQVAPKELVVARLQRCDPEVWDPMREMIGRMCGLAPLLLGVQGQSNEPRLRRVPGFADRRARVGEEKPRPLVVMAEYRGDTVGPTRGEPCRQAWLERLHRRTRLEPGSAIGERHAEHGRPRSLVGRLDGAGRFDVGADPVFDLGGSTLPAGRLRFGTSRPS